MTGVFAGEMGMGTDEAGTGVVAEDTVNKSREPRESKEDVAVVGKDGKGLRR